MSKPKTLEQTTIAESRLFRIEDVHLQFANHEQRHFERIRGNNGITSAVLIVPLLDAKTILLVREYGCGVDDYVLGFPKGATEQNEKLVDTVNRELMEEVGYGAHKIEPLGKLSISPNYMSAMMHIFLAEELYPQRLLGDEPEPIEVVPWRLSAVNELLQEPEFHEARSIAALYLLQRKLDERNF